jgi:hypothetical protein
VNDTQSRRERQGRRMRGTTLSWHRVIPIAAILLSGCHDATSPSTGALAGTVVLQDSWATTLADFSGVRVTVNGLSTVTDTAGAWRIDGVPAGRHDVTFEKATFGTVRVPGQMVDGPSTTAPTIFMVMPPWEQAIIDSIHIETIAGKDYYSIDGHLSDPPPSNAKAVATVAFIGRTLAVSPDTTSYGKWGTSLDRTGKSSTFSIPLRVDDMRSTFGAGAQVFVAAYVTSVTCGCYPNDPQTKPFFANTGPRANVIPLTIK